MKITLAKIFFPQVKTKIKISQFCLVNKITLHTLFGQHAIYPIKIHLKEKHASVHYVVYAKAHLSLRLLQENNDHHT